MPSPSSSSSSSSSIIEDDNSNDNNTIVDAAAVLLLMNTEKIKREVAVHSSIVVNNTNNKKKNIRARLENSDDSWNSKYRQLVCFYDQHGHSNVLRSDPDKKLSGWVKRQRNSSKAGKLSASKIQALNDLNFVWDRQEEAWCNKYELVVKYYSSPSSSSSSSISRNGTNKYSILAEWIQRQRREYRNSRLTMTTTRIEKLEALPNWNWEGPAQQQQGSTTSSTITASTIITASSSTASSTASSSELLEKFELPTTPMPTMPTLMPMAATSCSFDYFDAEHIFV